MTVLKIIVFELPLKYLQRFSNPILGLSICITDSSNDFILFELVDLCFDMNVICHITRFRNEAFVLLKYFTLLTFLYIEYTRK